eukprot:3787007-Rhodomonas_salina.3
MTKESVSAGHVTGRLVTASESPGGVGISPPGPPGLAGPGPGEIEVQVEESVAQCQSLSGPAVCDAFRVAHAATRCKRVLLLLIVATA